MDCLSFPQRWDSWYRPLPLLTLNEIECAPGILQLLNEMYKEGKLLRDSDGALYNPPEGGSTEVPPQPPEILPMDEFFNDGYYSDITVSSTFSPRSKFIFMYADVIMLYYVSIILHMWAWTCTELILVSARICATLSVSPSMSPITLKGKSQWCGWEVTNSSLNPSPGRIYCQNPGLVTYEFR